MIIHMLGGGPSQLSAIKRAKEKGYKVVVSDFNPNAPGHKISDFNSYASSFDSDAVLKDAVKYGSDYIMTTGTDQPVLTAAIVSEKLNLPFFLTSKQAEVVTNKKVMKNALKESGVATMPYVILGKDFKDEELDSLTFPLVIKPLDSQGQRGVLKVYNHQQIRENFSILLGYSRVEEILAEEYYPSDEITVTGWVKNEEATVLTITDRVTIDNGSHLGVCVSHRYPSIFHSKEDEILNLTEDIVNMIGIKEGPLYFQILGGEKGFVVNEIACRLGGAYEDEFIPWMTGVDLLNNMVDMTTVKDYIINKQSDVDLNLKDKFLSLQMFFTTTGVISDMYGMEEVKSIDGVINGSFLLNTGDVIKNRENSTQRAGYFIVTSDSVSCLNSKISKAYDYLKILDEEHKNMIEFYERMYYPV